MYLLIAIITAPYSPTGTLELVDSITNRNECLHLAYEFRREEAFQGVEFRCVKTTISVSAK